MTLGHHELLISNRDAEAIAALLLTHRRTDRLGPDGSDRLADLMMDARLVAAEQLPADRAALGSTVTYAEQPTGARRSVTLVAPEDADAARGRISVLSPVGLALIGRRRGDTVLADMPNGRELELHIVETRLEREPLREAA
jgi:regulator of nucleoside diphosphate kinase